MHNFVRSGLSFDVTDEGPVDGRLVIALHGFPEDRLSWSAVIPQLTALGYRVLAPDQRGYSPGARPKGRRAYVLGELAADVMALADVAGADRFDVVGHDWGAVVAWELAGRHPDRVRTVTSLTVPHPAALRDAVLHSRQLLKSWYMGFFQLPRVPEMTFQAVDVFFGRPAQAKALQERGVGTGNHRVHDRYPNRAMQAGLLALRRTTPKRKEPSHKKVRLVAPRSIGQSSIPSSS